MGASFSNSEPSFSDVIDEYSCEVNNRLNNLLKQFGTKGIADYYEKSEAESLNATSVKYLFKDWDYCFDTYLAGKTSQKHKWARIFSSKASEVTSLYQNKYLSQMFWRIFEFEEIPEIFSESSHNTSDYTSYVMRDELSKSILDDSSYEEKRFFRDLVAQHLSERDHPLCEVLSLFSKSMSEFVEQQLRQVHEDGQVSKMEKETKLNNLLRYIVSEVNEFIGVFIKTIKLFYSKVCKSHSLLQDRESLVNFILNRVFEEGRMHELVLEIYKITQEDTLKKLAAELRKLSCLKIEEFGVDHKFCLNELTMQLSKDVMAQSKTLSSGFLSDYSSIRRKTGIMRDSGLMLEDSGVINSVRKEESIRSHPSKCSSSLSEEVNSYMKSVDLIKSLLKTRGPCQKMSMIGQLNITIVEAVNNFWSTYLANMPRSALTISSDDLLNIVIYIISSLNDPEIHIHLMLIDDFCSADCKNESKSYYFYTVKAAVEYISTVCYENIKNKLI